MISSDHLNPGAVGRIKASVNTGGKTGLLVKHITIYSNDRTNPALSLSMTIDAEKK